MENFDLFKLNESGENYQIEVGEISENEIAIIGISSKMPLADSETDFWNNILNKNESLSEIKGQRKKDTDNLASLLDKEKKYIKASYLEEIDKFDYSFFKYSPIEAKYMDPNQKLFLETTFEAIEDAGYGGDKLKGTNTGIYVGYSDLMSYKYFQFIKEFGEDNMGVASAGNIPSIIPSRISYALDLKGPSMLIDTACSSSLSAVHIACQSLLKGDCEIAIAGGVRVNLLPLDEGVSIGIESSIGSTCSFDDSSDGTGIGEGVVSILLKPLSDATRDRDNIYGIIKGSALNQDGHSIGITAPNAKAQENVIITALNRAGINPETIEYIEAHGTGTQLGDPIEIEGLTNAFKRFTDKKQFCAISTVKSNIGHLFDVAGLAGLLKGVLAVKNKIIPPTINFTVPNRKINFEESPVYINDETKVWESQVRRCGISSFGLSGTNCHVILESFDYQKEKIKEQFDNYHILTISGKSKESLKKNIQKYFEFCINSNKSFDLQDFCYTANTGRGHYKYRMVFLFRTHDELIKNLDIAQRFEYLEENNIYYKEHQIVYQDNSDKLKEGECSEDQVVEYSKRSKETIERIITFNEKEYFTELCELYVKGARIDWEHLYKEQECFKISIPVYQFDRKRCWIDFSKQKTYKKENQEKNKYNIEENLTIIFKEELEFDDINLNTNFTELGIDSLLLTKLHKKINNNYPNIVKITDYYAYPSIYLLSKYINENAKGDHSEHQKTIKKEETISDKDIAIIGIDIKAGNAKNADELWEYLSTGKDLNTNFPEDRIKDIENYITDKGKTQENPEFASGGFLPSINGFDNSFFNINKNEANWMDPNQRIFLQSAYSAIEDAGYGGESLDGTKTGVYVGFANDFLTQYGRMLFDADPEVINLATPGNLASIIAGRLSYFLNLKGPSVVIDTSCSSSLTAVHMAVKAIRNNECDMAIAGGVKINLCPLKMNTEKIGIESTDSFTRTFDDQASGTGIGEGVGVVVLKRLSEAINDRDSIYAVIKGSALNQDGRTLGLTAPNSLAQAEVIVDAWADAEINPKDISYIEAHGTGTNLGDPIEIDGLCKAFSKFTKQKQFCAIGSVKPNLGHLFEAAGILSIIKVALMIKNRELPPSIHFTTPNRNISFEESPIFVNDTFKTWYPNGDRLLSGVSAFGFSGTNCHMILQEPPIIEEIDKESTCGNVNLLTFSAKTIFSLEKIISDFYNSIDRIIKSDVRDICFTTNEGRGHYKYRVIMVIKNKEEIKEKVGRLVNKGLKSDLNNNIFSNVQLPKNYKKNKIGIDSLNEMISYIRDNENVSEEILHKICYAYIEGNDINWEIMYGDECPKRIRLPKYYFDEKNCWFEQNNNTSKINTDNTLNNIRILGKENQDYTLNEIILANTWADLFGLKEIDIYDDFYSLGGDSILAIKLSKVISSRVNKEISAVNLMKLGNIYELSNFIDEKTTKVQTKKLVMKNDDFEDSGYYPLSYSQRRMYIMNQKNPNQTSYNIPAALILEGSVNKRKIEEGFKELIKRHESLRTSFKIIDGEIVQVINKNIEFILKEKECEDNLSEIINNFIEPFDLKTAPLIRATLVKIKENEHLLLIDMHHIISDWASMGIFAEEFVSIYNSIPLSTLEIQYKDFAIWQRTQMKTEELLDQEKYWLNKLSGNLPKINIFDKKESSDLNGNNANEYKFILDKTITNQVYKTSKELSSSLFMILLAAYKVLLNRYTGVRDIIVGTPISGRHYPEVEKAIGVFINTLAIRSKLDESNSFKSFLQEVKINCLEAYDNQDYPFEELYSKVSNSNVPLFNSIFGVQNISVPDISMNGIKIKNYDIAPKHAVADLSIEVIENYGELLFNVVYNNNLFSNDLIDQIIQDYEDILKIILENNEILIQDINIGRKFKKTEPKLLSDLTFDF